MSLFSGLEKFGLKDFKNAEIFQSKKKLSKENKNSEAKEKPFVISDYVYEKTVECPVCDGTFKTFVMRSGKMQPVSVDYDLRPIYREPIQPMFYDILSCDICGYTAITQMFNKILSRQIDNIHQSISMKFTAVKYPMQLTPEMAVDRYKLALLNAVVKDAKDGEKAYLCMKLAWLHRSIKKGEQELLFIEKAHDGFESAFTKDIMPICGLDENTIMYLIAAYAKTLGRYDEALRLASSLIVRKDINSRLKGRAHELKEAVNFEKKKLEIPK